jgi:formylglycine-generating enzyme required for sulfatase activity
MAKDPADRYPAAEAMAADLDALLAADEPRRPARLPKLPRQPPAWRRYLGPAVGLAVVAGLAVAAWAYLGPLVGSPPAKSTDRVPEPGLPTITNSIGMVLARVPDGKFVMGDSRIADAPPHRVGITRPFLIGVHEVTQKEYKDVVGSNPSEFLSELRPVDSVTWNEAVEFCEKLSVRASEKVAGRAYRLPTEAEWEFACRAGSGTAFGIGMTISPETANTRLSGLHSTAPVGTYPPNRWGLYDMQGNVWEWCADWYDAEYYRDAPVAQDPPGPEKPTRTKVTRGGSWQTEPADCRAAFRNDTFAPTERSPMVGFRVVCTLAGGS